ncbi:MAG: hypothetical protein ACI9MC_001734 [Kiritimatiellia bacterium]|jgi:hypothetical protein
MRIIQTICVAMMLACGSSEETKTACGELCAELVEGCESGAYPDMDSCMNGCALEAEQGANVPEYSTCVEQAECDQFAIVDCQDQHGG